MCPCHGQRLCKRAEAETVDRMRSRPITMARVPLPRVSVTFSASCRQQLIRKKLVSPSVHWSPWRTRGDGQTEVGHGGAVGGEAELGVVGQVPISVTVLSMAMASPPRARGRSSPR